MRITPLGYMVLGIIVIVMLIGVYFIIWSTSSARKAGEGNLLSSSVTITPTPSLAPVDNATPTPTIQPTDAPTNAPSAPPETPTPTPKPDDTPVPEVKTPSPSQVQGALDGRTTSKLRLRQGPGEQYPILQTYVTGTQLKVYAREGDFYFVMVVKEKRYGYMSVDYVEKDGLLSGETTTPAPTAPEGAVIGTVRASVAALRNVPSTENNTPFGEVKKGVTVYVYSETDGFYYIEVAGTGTKGYTKADFITVTDSVSKATPKQ